MNVLSGLFLMVSIVGCQVTSTERDQQNLRLVSNGTILSTHERWSNTKWFCQHSTEICSCKDYPDGTPCTKRCIDITCDSKMARCWKVFLDAGTSLEGVSSRIVWKLKSQGHCKRSTNHPCEVRSWEMFIHPCCCGDCENPKVGYVT